MHSRNPLSRALLCAAGLFAGAASANEFPLGTDDEIRSSASKLAYDLMLQYDGNQTGKIPGILPGPPTEHKGDYYWWEGGAMMGTYIDYWHLTGDESYNKVVMEGILHQTGDNGDFMPKNHTASLGNDDQGFWGMTAMLAAENKFPNPPDDEFQWLELAQGTWATQAHPNRYDETCGGGLRWQVPFTNQGYNYKNTIANGCFFNLGARLARYTGNSTYAEYAERAWDWLWAVNYIDHEEWKVYDGAHVEKNCTDINKATFSYNAAIMLQGAAFLYNFTDGDTKWKDRVDNLLDSMLETFFETGVAYEVACEPLQGACTTDMLSFKGYVARWLSVVTQIVPYTADKVRPILRKSAEAAAKQCTGGPSGRRCGFYWTSGAYVDIAVDKTSGAGENMNVLAAVSSLLIGKADPPATNETGGISRGNPDAGANSKDNTGADNTPVTQGDRAGAGIITFLLLSGALGTGVWMTAFD